MPALNDPCWRRNGAAALSLPHRVRMPDGTTRTDPAQWSLDQAVLAATGWSASTLTQDDLDLLFPPPAEPSWEEAGYETGEGWRLGWTTDDVALLTGLYVLASRAAALGIDQPVVVIDMAGERHTLTLAEFETLMMGYGAARAAASARGVA